MVGVPYDFVFAKSAAIFLQPATDPIPGNDRIEHPGEGVNGKINLAGDGTGVILSHQMQAMFGGLALSLGEMGDEFLNGPMGFGRMTKPPSRYFGVAEQNASD